MHREQAGHHGRIFLWRPGHHLGFDVIGENGVEHRLLLVGLAGLAAPLKDDSARIIPTSGPRRNIPETRYIGSPLNVARQAHD